MSCSASAHRPGIRELPARLAVKRRPDIREIRKPSQHQRIFDSATYQYNMSYDGHGRLDVLTYPTSTSGYRFKVDYDYDAYGQLQYVKDGNESYTYYELHSTDALGRPVTVELGNGRWENLDFDKAAGYLENIQTDGSVQNLTMTYDEVGNVLSKQDSLISKTETYGYDYVNRLTSSQVTGQSSVSIAYSAAGRITSKTGLGSYTYGAGSAGPFAVTSANSVSYTYDANGRMITRGSGEIDWYSYDLPAKIDDLSDSSYTEFWYGPDRSRIKQYQSASGATIRYAGTLFEFEDAAADTYRHHVLAGDKVIAVVERVSTTNTRQYLHRDHQGSVVKVTDASGAVLQSLAFDAWGLRRDASNWSALGSPFAGSHETERGYTGHEHLDTVGLIHMNGRVQDPILGRFISADPLIQAPYHTQSHNRYSYVWNNPGSLIDPSGFGTEDAQWLVDTIRSGNLDCSQYDCGQIRQFLIDFCNSDDKCVDYDQMVVYGSRSGNDSYVPMFGIRLPVFDDGWFGVGGGGGGAGYIPAPNRGSPSPGISDAGAQEVPRGAAGEGLTRVDIRYNEIPGSETELPRFSLTRS